MTHYLKTLERTVRDNWDYPALCNYKGEQFTHCELATNIEKFHILFRNVGIKKGEKISLCARNSARWAISFLAINTYESVVVPILNEFTPESVAKLVNHSDSTALFTDAEIWARINPESVPNIKFVISCSNFTLLYARDESIKKAFENIHNCFITNYPLGFSRKNVNYPTGNDKDIAVINYTSGTTSAPKGVILRYECFNATIDFGCTYSPAKPWETVISMLPMGHIYGLVFEFLYPLCCGVTVYFLGKTPSPSLLVNAMKEIKPYQVVSVPLVIEKIYKSSIKPAISKWYMRIILNIPGIGDIVYRKIGAKVMSSFGGNVRKFILGGAALNSTVEKCLKRMRLPYTVGYGMTEAAPLLAYETPEKYVRGSCGKAIDCTQIRIDSEDPYHIAGEIQAKGTNICSGYYKNEEANANAFTADGFLRTGDLGIMDMDGNIFIKGRSKTMILSANGQNIYPEEIEAVINSQRFVSESVVVDRASKIVALVYLDKEAIEREGLDGEEISDIPEKVRISANRQLPSYSLITKIEVVPVPFEKTPKFSIKRFLYK